MNSGLGSSLTYGATLPYLDYLSALAGDATTANDATALANLPVQANNPVNGSSQIIASTANLRALGFNAQPPTGQPDGTVSLNTSIMNLSRTSIDPSKYDLMAVASHEIDEVLGIGSALNGLTNGAPTPTGAVFPMDLFRYDQSGNRSFTSGLNAQAYFSLNGATLLVRYNQTGGADFGDWYSTGQPARVQNAFGTPGATPNLGVELTALDVIGYDLVPEPWEWSTVACLGLVGLAVHRRWRR
jgi:hypothetical protein